MTLDWPLEDGAIHRARVYKNWRWNYNTGGGQLMDWIGHHGDIAHWGLGFDSTGPSEVDGYGNFPLRTLSGILPLITGSIALIARK